MKDDPMATLGNNSANGRREVRDFPMFIRAVAFLLFLVPVVLAQQHAPILPARHVVTRRRHWRQNDHRCIASGRNFLRFYHCRSMAENLHRLV